ncbi:MAG: DUF1553 domain-containing protein [Planctomycetes bacterium]|nr:DUF1553 domain-containing protein [Planctomycetota bacterium]
MGTLLLMLALADAKHWSFQPVARPPLPAVKNAAWARQPIDLFILARLEAQSLSPSPEADRTTLIRRLYLDLLGLPPSLAEVDRFLADRRPDAFERLVDDLLASPHYGERWARQWLDAARYADTNGFEKDAPRLMWRYRDWVIDALNRDLPFDQFAIEQLAGDMLPGAGRSQKVATGFHRNTLINDEGGVDQEQFRYEAVVDRTNTTGTVFLGLSLGCAQCHDHKYDPLTQKEYFQLFAFFNNAEEPLLEAPTAEEAAKRQAHEEAVAALERELLLDSAPGREELYERINRQQAGWEKERAKTAKRWTVLQPSRYASQGNAAFALLPDRSLLAGGPSPQADTYVIECEPVEGPITALRLEVLPHPSLPGGGPGRGRILGDGNFVLSEISVKAATVIPGKRWAGAGNSGETAGRRELALELGSASADYSQKNFEVQKAIDGDLESGWSIEAGKPGMNIARAAVFEVKGEAGFAGGARLIFTLVHNYTHEHNIGRLRLSVTGDPQPALATGMAAAVEEALVTPEARRTEQQKQELKKYYRAVAPELAELQHKLAEQRKAAPVVTTAMVLEERERPRPTRIHIRGEYLQEGEEVQPEVPACLPPLPKDALRNRLTLARWLVDPRNPLTARVAANRVWQAWFGRGLVGTPENFGTRGEPPTHPELLDWLASEFMRQGWSLKALHRLIATSATYRQSSAVAPELLRLDPYNTLLARGPRFRVDAEVIRDAVLAASGLLSRKIGGPSVFPPQPEGVSGLSFGAFEWKTAGGEDRYRRGLYTYWKRTNPYAAFITFDAPPGTTACVRRLRANTPLQALTLLNDPAFTEAAQALARRVLRDGPPDRRGRLAFAFRLCLSRPPGAEELEDLAGFVERQWRRFRDQPAESALAAFSAAGARPEGVDPAEAAAWTLLARALFNLDEMITKE